MTLLEAIYMSAMICKVQVFFRKPACRSVSPTFLKKLDKFFSDILIFTTPVMVLLNAITKEILAKVKDHELFFGLWGLLHHQNHL